MGVANPCPTIGQLGVVNPGRDTVVMFRCTSFFDILRHKTVSKDFLSQTELCMIYLYMLYEVISRDILKYELLIIATKKVFKGVWRMPRLTEAMKDVISCDKLRLGANDL